jgi:acyl-CoA-dependent ceramide synthase
MRDSPQKPEPLSEISLQGVMNRQYRFGFDLMALVLSVFLLVPSSRAYTSAFFTLSYRSSSIQGNFSPGPQDIYLVASFIGLFTALRTILLNYALVPLATYCGITKRKLRMRFAEQSYMAIYFALYWCWGISCFIYETPTGVKSVESLLLSLFEGFPRPLLNTSMKLYYISQLAFWIQQIIVVHIEERRKDHIQMLTHHFITVALLVTSYAYRQWRVGNAVLVCMDLVDIVLPLAKMLRYLSFRTACDAAFGLFVILWFVMRHILYMSICWSLFAHAGKVTWHYGTYSVATGERISEEGGKDIARNLFQSMAFPSAETVAFNHDVRWFFLTLLLALQGVCIAWFAMICRIIVRVLQGQGANDTRSDSEESCDEYDSPENIAGKGTNNSSDDNDDEDNQGDSGRQVLDSKTSFSKAQYARSF